MKNMGVSKKLIAGFLVMIVLSVCIGMVGLFGMWSIRSSANEMYDYNVLAISAMGELRELFANERNDMRRLFLDRDDPAVAEAVRGNFSAYDNAAAEYFAQYEESITDPSAEADYFAAKEAWYGPFEAMKRDMWAQVGAGNMDAAYQIFQEGSAVIAPITTGFAASTLANDDWAAQAKAHTNELSFLLLIVLVIVLLISITVAMMLALYIASLISKPLAPLTMFMNKAGAAGEIVLDQEDLKLIDQFGKRKDEVGQLIHSTSDFIKRLHAVNSSLAKVAGGDLTAELDLLSDADTMGLSLQRMIENLNSMFAEINAASVQVSSASEQIASGAQSLALGSTEQASSIEELSASMSEIAGQTEENASIAKAAAALSGTIRSNAEKGSEQMDQMMHAVMDINEASSQISKVIKVIDDIAFQTNILALNAAVEAARAGQHGKGFAVVAEEVRNLAAKSAEAAKDTGALIENSIEKANFGLGIATETTDSLKEIVEGIRKNAEMVAQIAQSSDEQACAIAQINAGIDQVAQVVQQNSATAEENAAASEEMSGQSGVLTQLISQFKLKETDYDLPLYAEPSKKIYVLPGRGGKYKTD